MPKMLSSSASAKGKDAAPDGAAQEAEWKGEWGSLNFAQKRRIVGAEACISFHPIVGHPLYPHMAVVRFLPSLDVDRVNLVRDANLAEMLQHDLCSALHWQSPLLRRSQNQGRHP